MSKAYYLQELPEEVQDFLVADTDDPLITPQDYLPEDKELHKQALNSACLYGKVAIFYDGKIAVVLTRKTQYVGNVDTKVGADASAKDVIRGYRSFVEWAKKETFYYKLETRTPLEKFAKVMTKSVPGAKLEGVREKSYMTKEGNMIDEYLVGFKLKEVEPCQ
jgi:hypothetical protein